MTEGDDPGPNEPPPDLSKITDRLRGPLGFVAIGIGMTIGSRKDAAKRSVRTLSERFSRPSQRPTRPFRAGP